MEFEVWREEAASRGAGNRRIGSSDELRRLEHVLSELANGSGGFKITLDVASVQSRMVVANFMEPGMRSVLPKSLHPLGPSKSPPRHPRPGLDGVFRRGDELLCDKLSIEIDDAVINEGKPVWVVVFCRYPIVKGSSPLQPAAAAPLRPVAAG